MTNFIQGQTNEDSEVTITFGDPPPTPSTAAQSAPVVADTNVAAAPAAETAAP